MRVAGFIAAVLAMVLGAAVVAPAHPSGRTCTPNPQIPDSGDADCDGVRTDGNGPVDNCPTIRNADQANTDGGFTATTPESKDALKEPMEVGDAAGDACDADDDADGVDDHGGSGAVLDNCRLVRNPGQFGEPGDYGGLDAEGGRRICPPGDKDNDGSFDDVDNCPNLANSDQSDFDYDRRGDVCDNDDDNDGAYDGVDNCPHHSNKDQQDADGDGVGRICDDDEIVPPAKPSGGTSAGAPDRTAPALGLSLPSGLRVRNLVGGLPAAVRCSEACSLTATVALTRRDAKRLRIARTLPSSTAFLGGAGQTFLFVRVPRALERMRMKSVRARLTLRATDDAGNATSVTRRITLRR